MDTGIVGVGWYSSGYYLRYILFRNGEMTAQYSPGKQAQLLELAERYLHDYPHASKKALMQATGIGHTYVEKWCEAGHLKFVKRSPRDNWRGN